MNTSTSTRIDKDTAISLGCRAFEVRTEMQDVCSRSKARSEPRITGHSTRRVVHRDGRIVLTGVRQIGEIQQDQGAGAVIMWELETKQGGVVRSCHINPDARCQLYSKVSWVRLDRFKLIFRLSLILRIDTAIHIVLSTLCIGKEREIP